MKLKPWPKLQELLRPLSKYELDELAESIKEHGIVQEILVLPDGRIIDGYHRWKVAGGKVPFKIMELSEGEAFALGIILNLALRQLTPEQINELNEEREKLKKLVKKLRKNGKTQQEVSEITQIPQQTISVWERGESNTKVGNASPPDCRMIVPSKEHEKIYERTKEGETHREIAADYGITRQRIGQIIKRVEIIQNQETPELPHGKYNVIMADPPWRYEDTATSGAAENHYPTMDIEDICALKIPCADNSILFLWTTMPQIKNGLRVLESWGFQYKTGMVWVKDKIGIGNYARLRHELVLIGTRGKIGTPDYKNRPDSVIEAPRTKHSEKPTELYEIIEKMFPHEKRLELFARTKRNGWTSWGNEIED